jgi:hypothetical protein
MALGSTWVASSDPVAAPPDRPDGEVLVGFGDRLRAWLRGDDSPQNSPDPKASRSVPPAGRGVGSRRARRQHPARGFDGGPLLEFARSRNGVEVYLEPRTNLYGDSVLLVADDGEYLRRPVPDAATARRFCSEHGIPVYDAARTGYPRRVRDYDRGVRPRRIGLEDLPPWPGAGSAENATENATEGRLEEPTQDEEPPPPPPPPASPGA